MSPQENASCDSPLSFIDLLAQAPTADPDKPRPTVKRLLEEHGVNLIVFTFSPGQSLPNHRAAHPIMVSALSGSLIFSSEGHSITLIPGSTVYLKDHITHRVDCPKTSGDKSVLLLTMLTGGQG